MKRKTKRKTPSQLKKEAESTIKAITLGALVAVAGLLAVEALELTAPPAPKVGSCVIERYTVGTLGSLELPRFVFSEDEDVLQTVAYYPDKCTINSGRGRLTSKSQARHRMRTVPCCAENMYEKDTN